MKGKEEKDKETREKKQDKNESSKKTCKQHKARMNRCKTKLKSVSNMDQRIFLL